MGDSVEFIEKMTQYFSIFDESFISGYIKIIENFYGELINKQKFNSLEEMTDYIKKLLSKISENKKISISSSFEKALEFFRVLGPKYEQMAHNILADSGVEILKGNNGNSSGYHLELSGNENDASVIVHEVTHDFVTSKQQAEDPRIIVPEEKYSTIFTILSEINSYVLQLLFYDFCHKYDLKEDEESLLISLITIPFLKNKMKYLESSKNLFQILCRAEGETRAQEVFDGFCLRNIDGQINHQFEFTQEMAFYSHPFGMIVASYIYQEILKDPNNIIMYLGLEKAQATVGDEAKILKFLENLGIPCFKDGRISLDDECVAKLTESLIKTYNKCSNKEREFNNPFFQNYPMITEEHIEQVNDLFNALQNRSI